MIYVLGSQPDMAQRWASRGVKFSILLEVSVMNSSVSSIQLIMALTHDLNFF